jgi:integrase
MFNLAIDSKLRGCDVVAIRVEDVAAGGYTADRATVRQKKTGRPVRFELSEQTRQAVDDYLKAANKRPGEFLFTGGRGANRNMTTRQYARLVSEWIGSVGLDPRLFGTHSLRRTKATLKCHSEIGHVDPRRDDGAQPRLVISRRSRSTWVSIGRAPLCPLIGRRRRAAAPQCRRRSSAGRRRPASRRGRCGRDGW